MLQSVPGVAVPEIVIPVIVKGWLKSEESSRRKVKKPSSQPSYIRLILVLPFTPAFTSKPVPASKLPSSKNTPESSIWSEQSDMANLIW